MCRANYDFKAMNPDELSFPKDAIISHVIKTDDDWWEGEYPAGKKGFFPSNYVDEMDSESLMADDKELNALGSLEQDVFNISQLSVQLQKGTTKNMFVLRLSDSGTNKSLDCGFEDEADLKAWYKALTEAIENSKSV
jgi:hypothetical protein